MPNWKKVVVSGSNAHLNQVTASYFSGDGSALTDLPITIKDEGSNLTTSVSSIDFVGSGVTATTDGNNVTATIAGADLINVFEEDSDGNLQPTTSNTPISVFYELDSNNDIQPSA
jgi:hypothetical protein